MKVYKKLDLPKDTAWDRPDLYKKIVPGFIRKFLTGIKSVLRWLPTIYRDRNWDSWYILEILKKKIEFQREYIVSHNRHLNVDTDNKYMTLALNLLERSQEEFYLDEKFNYEQSDIEFVPLLDKPGFSEIKINIISQKYKEYLTRYRGALRRMLDDYPELRDKSRKQLCHYLSKYNQDRADRLLWRIMDEHSPRWWD